MTAKPEAWKNKLTGELSHVEVLDDGWVPLFLFAEFDVVSPEQEELAIKYSIDICSGLRPDAVGVLEMAQALYLAEMKSNGN